MLAVHIEACVCKHRQNQLGNSLAGRIMAAITVLSGIPGYLNLASLSCVNWNASGSPVSAQLSPFISLARPGAALNVLAMPWSQCPAHTH